MGPTLGPSGADRTQVGSMLVPWTLLSGTCIYVQVSSSKSSMEYTWLELDIVKYVLSFLHRLILFFFYFSTINLMRHNVARYHTEHHGTMIFVIRAMEHLLCACFEKMAVRYLAVHCIYNWPFQRQIRISGFHQASVIPLRMGSWAYAFSLWSPSQLERVRALMQGAQWAFVLLFFAINAVICFRMEWFHRVTSL